MSVHVMAATLFLPERMGQETDQRFPWHAESALVIKMAWPMRGRCVHNLTHLFFCIWAGRPTTLGRALVSLQGCFMRWCGVLSALKKLRQGKDRLNFNIPRFIALFHCWEHWLGKGCWLNTTACVGVADIVCCRYA